MPLSKREALRKYCLLIKNRLNSPIQKTKVNVTEVHHIIPRCVCGLRFLTESKYNLIRLYAREHWLAHYYLSIIFPHNVGIQRSFYLMCNIRGSERYQNIDEFCVAYENAKKNVLKNHKNKSYTDLYGKSAAEKIKIKKKQKQIDRMIRIIPLDK